MKFLEFMRDGFRVYSNNLTTFVFAMICAIAGSIFVVTAPPLLFGLYYMGFKASKNEVVALSDLLYGFKLTVKSWVYVIVVFVLILAVTSASYSIVKYLKLPVVVSFLIVLSVFTCWTTLLMFLLIYSIPSIVGKNKGVLEGIRESITLVCREFATTLSLFISLTLVIVFVGWIPVFGPLVVVPYQIITYSKAAIHLSE